MNKVYQGRLWGQGLHVGLVVSRFNELVTSRLLAGAQAALQQHGVVEEDVTVAHVPGAFELPLVAKTMAQSGQYDAILCLGAIIRGETPHFEYVAQAASSGIARVGLETGVPMIFGVITADTLDQALERAGGKAGNKGAEAALAAIEMAGLLKSLRGQ